MDAAQRRRRMQALAAQGGVEHSGLFMDPSMPLPHEASLIHYTPPLFVDSLPYSLPHEAKASPPPSLPCMDPLGVF